MTLIIQRKKNFNKHLLKMKICSITLNITVFTKHKDSTNYFEINQYLGQRKRLHLKFPLGQCVTNRILPPYYENSGVLPFPLHLQCLTAIFKCLYQYSELLYSSETAVLYVNIQEHWVLQLLNFEKSLPCVPFTKIQ